MLVRKFPKFRKLISQREKTAATSLRRNEFGLVEVQFDTDSIFHTIYETEFSERAFGSQLITA